eukprot:PhM_4_TR3112/c0_g1_i1/m.21919
MSTSMSRPVLEVLARKSSARRKDMMMANNNNTGTDPPSSVLRSPSPPQGTLPHQQVMIHKPEQPLLGKTPTRAGSAPRSPMRSPTRAGYRINVNFSAVSPTANRRPSNGNRPNGTNSMGPPTMVILNGAAHVQAPPPSLTVGHLLLNSALHSRPHTPRGSVRSGTPTRLGARPHSARPGGQTRTRTPPASMRETDTPYTVGVAGQGKARFDGLLVDFQHQYHSVTATSHVRLNAIIHAYKRNRFLTAADRTALKTRLETNRNMEKTIAHQVETVGVNAVPPCTLRRAYAVWCRINSENTSILEIVGPCPAQTTTASTSSSAGGASGGGTGTPRGGLAGSGTLATSSSSVGSATSPPPPLRGDNQSRLDHLNRSGIGSVDVLYEVMSLFESELGTEVPSWAAVFHKWLASHTTTWVRAFENVVK